jgi:hypothetical protein
MTHRTSTKVLVLSFALVLLAGAVFAQLQSGNLYGTTNGRQGSSAARRLRDADRSGRAADPGHR